ncbi:MAG: sigma-70 family RNA polymerase sigma factor [Verrucomicrobiota bacterium]
MSLPDPLPPLADEAALLRLYQGAPGEAAFRQLVALHLPLVWSTARRLVNGDASLAEDVTQIVFTDFARKAPALPPDTIAAGWLHRHTCFTARKMVRTEVRRRIREHSAAQMLIDDAMPADPHPLWPEAAPHLDAALGRLSRPDREALLLRFWQRQDHRSIGTALGSTEEAARKRIARALEKLRTVLRRRGVLLTAALLTQFLNDHATAAVPSPLAATLPGAAWRQATATGPITTPPASLFRRFWPAAAAALLVTGGLWTAANAGRFSPSVTRASLAASANAKTPASAASPEISLHFTLADLPAKDLSLRLLTYQAGQDDEALFNEVQKLTFTGGNLLEFDITTPSGQSRTFEKIRNYDYAGRWIWDEKTQLPQSTDIESKKLGTSLEAIPLRLAGGGVQLEWALAHHYAEPEFHAWPIPLDDPDGASGSVVKMEDFHRSSITGDARGLVEGNPRLLTATFLASAALPDVQPEPRTLLLFVTLTAP